MDAINIEQHKLIVEKAEELIKVCLEIDIDYLQDIIKKSKNIIDDYNNKNSTVIDVTKTENGKWSSLTKRIICAKYLAPINKTFPDVDDIIVYDFICKEHRRSWEEDSEGNWKKIPFQEGDDDWSFDKKDLCNSCKQKVKQQDLVWYNLRQLKDNIRIEFNEACANTVFSPDLKLKSILLSRKIPNWYETTPFQKTIKASIREEILKCFQEQNEALINQYKDFNYKKLI